MRKACCTGALVSCGAHAQGCFLDTLERLGGGGRACTTRRGQSRIHALCATQWGLLDEPHARTWYLHAGGGGGRRLTHDGSIVEDYMWLPRLGTYRTLPE
eukprot:122719-Prymnesium_polylepis.1